ncbi:hypothetical protein GYH30_004454 [Glycine max]|nr:hypothetical protein GYH30_004454 [Glycine max]
MMHPPKKEVDRFTGGRMHASMEEACMFTTERGWCIHHKKRPMHLWIAFEYTDVSVLAIKFGKFQAKG